MNADETGTKSTVGLHFELDAVENFWNTKGAMNQKSLKNTALG